MAWTEGAVSVPLHATEPGAFAEPAASAGKRPRRGLMPPLRSPEQCPPEVAALQQACISEDPDDRPSAAQVGHLSGSTLWQAQLTAILAAASGRMAPSRVGGLGRSRACSALHGECPWQLE